ncbi:unnamed protein product [Cylindrotheca closterium]|uniref:Phosphoribosyltransferase domain-containing protein n=1 Tax=Cylindrotheca closterium TaxID=2856 RepID=A0AAD2G0L3_9STRA|nr:unnamed protein product [Cylindrotheca closterium]
MERQRLTNLAGQNQDPYIAAAMSASSPSIPQGDMMGPSSVDALNAPPAAPSRTANSGASTFSPNSGAASGGGFGGLGGYGNGGTSGEDLAALEPRSKPASLEEQKAADATLSEYELFQVDDNWLDKTLQERMMSFEAEREEDELSIDEETELLLDQLEALPDDYGDNRDDRFGADDNNGEPWDMYGMDESEKSEIVGGRKIPIPEPGSEFYLDLDEPADPEEQARLDAEFWDRMKDCQLSSRRLERARRSDRAKAFFSRDPNRSQGFDRLWVTAFDNGVFRNIVGLMREYGVEFADNFGDFESTRPEDGLYTVEDVASFKARKVYEVTGLPTVSCHTSFEIEPVPPTSPIPKTKGSVTVPTNTPPPRSSNPRVLSGYRICDIGMHVDYICDAMRPVSEPTRVTRFSSCVCYYDGEMEIFEHAVCDVDLHFSNSLRTDIPLSKAIHDMTDMLKLTHGLEYQKYLRQHMDDVLGGSLGPASVKLRDRVLRDGKVLPNKIIDVSAFMDSQVDVNLMDDCAKELSTRFMDCKPTKILTVATTGLVIALPMAKYLQVPVVYARKERNVVMADTYKATYSSKTVGINRELLVSTSHIDPGDRILVVDDFLSSGATQEALLTIISDAGATAVGVGVLLEKAYLSGRQSLSGYNIPIHSLCRVASVEQQSIQLVEEEGYESL